MAVAKTYSAKDIEVLEGLAPVRKRPGMYIGGTDETAYHHLANEILDVVGDRHLEIHLDLNTDPNHKSNVALREATGLVFGMIGIEPKVKHESWAASTAADRLTKQERSSEAEQLAYIQQVGISKFPVPTKNGSDRKRVKGEQEDDFQIQNPKSPPVNNTPAVGYSGETTNLAYGGSTPPGGTNGRVMESWYTYQT